MKITLLTSVAAISLLAATHFVTAQGTSPGGMKEAPAPKADTPPAPPKASGSQATPDVKGDPKPGTADTKPATGQTKPTAADTKPATGDTKPDAADSKPAGRDAKPAASDTKPATGDTKPAAADSKPAGGDTKPAASDTKSDAAKPAAATAAPPPEKRTEITTTIKQTKVQEVTNVNFNISIGSRVPSSVTYTPLPPRIVEIYPEWRGYYFILVKGRYLILRPQTYEIVYIIEG